MCDIIMATNDLVVGGLIDLTYSYVVSQIKGLSVEELRDNHKIKNDFTPKGRRRRSGRKIAYAFD